MCLIETFSTPKKKKKKREEKAEKHLDTII